MADWFAPKRFGYGAGLPISWQGWALTIAFVALACLMGLKYHEQPALAFAVLFPATLIYLLIAARTTRGGWRWRWGDSD